MDILSLSPEDRKKYNQAINYSQLFNGTAAGMFNLNEEASAALGQIKQDPVAGKKVASFNPDAGDGVDPFTGATAKDYASLLSPVVDQVKSWGHNTFGAAEIATSMFMHNLDLTADYISRKTGIDKGGIFQKMSEGWQERGIHYKAKAKEEGIGPITEFLTDVMGGAIPGITDFITDLPFVFPLHATRYAEKNLQKSVTDPTKGGEFVSLLKGAMERNLMGQVFHAASLLPRTARVPAIGVLFEEQSRLGEGVEDPTELAKAFLTGGIFGTVGGPGKIGMRDVVTEIHNLSKEAASSRAAEILSSERGSLEGLDRWLSPTSETIKAKGEAIMPAKEWSKRIIAWEDKNPHMKDENQWNGLHEWLEGKEGEKVTKEDITEFLELSKGDWAVLNKKGEDPWADRNIPGGIPGTEKVYTLSIPKGENVYSSPHFSDTPNVILHFRTQERVDTGGKKGIIVETIQSDWHQQSSSKDKMWEVQKDDNGEDSQYWLRRNGDEEGDEIGPFNAREEANKALREQGEYTVRLLDKDGSLFGEFPSVELAEIYRDANLPKDIVNDTRIEIGTAPAPFEKTWPEVALKHAIDIAVQDPDIKWIAWPSGKVQGKRWGVGAGQEWVDQRTNELLVEYIKRFVEENGREPTEREKAKEYDAASEDAQIEAEGDEGLGGDLERLREALDNGDIDRDEFDRLSREMRGKGDSFLTILYDKRIPQFAGKYIKKMGGKYNPKLVSVDENMDRDAYVEAAVSRMRKEDPDLVRGGVWDIAAEEAEEGMEYSVHRIDITPAMRDKINAEGQTFYSGLDITQLPKILKDLGENIEEAIPYIQKAGKAIFKSGKNTRAEWVETMKTTIGPEWKKYADQLEELWTSLEAANMDQRQYRPALKVGDKVYEANLDETNHGQVWNKIPSAELESGKDVISGWVDREGKWAGEKLPSGPATQKNPWEMSPEELSKASEGGIIGPFSQTKRSEYEAVSSGKKPFAIQGTGKKSTKILEEFPDLARMQVSFPPSSERGAKLQWNILYKKGNEDAVNESIKKLQDLYANPPKQPGALNVEEGRIFGYSEKDVALWYKNKYPPQPETVVGVKDVKGKVIDAGGDITLGQAEDLIKAITGDKVDIAKLASLDPEMVKLYNETRKALKPSRIHNIKKIIRQVTGQIKVHNLVEVREDKGLIDQIRFAARQAKIAFREGKKEGNETTADRFHLTLEKAKARKEAREATNEMISDLKKVDPAGMTDYARGEIESLLGNLDFATLSNDKFLSLQKTRDWFDKNSDTELPDHVLDDLARLDKTPIRDLSFGDLQTLHTAVMHLAEQSDKAQHLWDGIQKRRFDQAKKEAAEEMRPPDQVLKDVISTRPGLLDKVVSVGDWVRQTLGIRQDSYDLVVESLAGINSTMYRVLYQMIKEGDRSGVIPGKGIIGQKKYVQDAHAKFREDLENTGFFDEAEILYGKIKKTVNVDKWLNDRITVKGEKTWILSRGERMALYLHSLNEDNRAAIIESGIGFKRAPESSGIRPNEVIQVSEGDLQLLVDSLSSAEKKFVIPVQNLFERQGGDLDEVFYNLNKYRMELQQSYYPKEVMPLSRGGMDLETEEGMEAFRQFTARVGIDKGRLVSRIGSTKPIYLNDLMADVSRSVDWSATYINLEGPMRNASHLLYDNEFKANIEDRYGRETWIELEKGLKDISSQYRRWSETEKGIMKLKTNTVSSILGANIWIWLNQPFSLALYNVYVEPKYLLRGAIDTATPSGFTGTLDTIRQYSPEIVDRMQGGYDRDVAMAFQQSRDREFYGGSSTPKEKLLAPTRYADLTAVIPGMRASYFKAMDEIQSGKLSNVVSRALDITDKQAQDMLPAEMEAAAWKFADWTTERTQAQSTPEHRSSLSRSASTLEQVFTALSSQQNAMLNLVRRTQREYMRTGDPGDRDAMIKAYLQVFVVNAIFMMGIDKARDFVYGRDPKPALQSFVDNAAGMVMFLREIESGVSSHLFEGGRGFDVKYPVNRFSELMTDMAANVNTMVVSTDMKARDEAQKKFMDNTLSLIGVVSGYPYQTPKRIFDAVAGDNPKPKHKVKPDFQDQLLD